jgi:hypothetical protein
VKWEQDLEHPLYILVSRVVQHACLRDPLMPPLVPQNRRTTQLLRNEQRLIDQLWVLDSHLEQHLLRQLLTLGHRRRQQKVVDNRLGVVHGNLQQQLVDQISQISVGPRDDLRNHLNPHVQIYGLKTGPDLLVHALLPPVVKP